MHFTRMKGAGAVAHEWTHALDHHMGIAASKRFGSLTFFSEASLLYRQKSLANRHPSCRAMREILVAMRGDWPYIPGNIPCFHEEAWKLSGSKEGYWDSPREMFARAFEAAVHDELVDVGRRSDYLVYGVEENRFADEKYRGNPYPIGQERLDISAKIFEAMETWKNQGHIG